MKSLQTDLKQILLNKKFKKRISQMVLLGIYTNAM